MPFHALQTQSNIVTHFYGFTQESSWYFWLGIYSFKAISKKMSRHKHEMGQQDPFRPMPREYSYGIYVLRICICLMTLAQFRVLRWTAFIPVSAKSRLTSWPTGYPCDCILVGHQTKTTV